MRVFIRSLSLTACAVAALALNPAAGQAQGRQIVGTYSTTITSPQGAVKAVIVLKKENGAIGGTLSADGFPTIPVTTVTPSDTGLTLQADTPDGGVAVAMKFGAANTISGTVVYQGAQMAFDGTFTPEGSAPMGAAAGAPMNATGEYTLKASEPLMGQAEFAVQCSLSRAPGGAYSGTCGNEQGAAAVSTVTVVGNEVTMTGDSPIGAFKVVAIVSGATVSGTLTLGAESSKIKGSYSAK